MILNSFSYFLFF